MPEQQIIKIMVVDDDKDIRVNTVDLLSTQYPRIVDFDSPQTALAEIYPHMPVIILTDLRMPGGDGLEFAQAVREIDEDLPVILMTGYGDISIAVDAMKHGVYDFIEKPVDTDRLLKSIQRAVDKRRLSLSLLEAQNKLEQQSGIEARLIGNSPMMKQLKQSLLQLAPMDLPIMIYGETGVGKELVARSLHDYSERKDGNFVALNCAAIPEQLAEAELFGYEKGAFTDAKSAHIGKLEYANGGSLFLDEIESLSLSMQAKLLRVLQDGVISPLGSNEERKTNCRIISASKDELRNHQDFRQDLFFRLQVGELRIPPLRQRKEDIIMLFEYFVMQSCENFKIEYLPLTDDSGKQLLAYDWPGNIREMINVATRYAINGCQNLKQLLFNVEPSVMENQQDLSLKEQLNDYEENLIRSRLALYEGNVSAVLADLKLERRTFNQKLSRYNISTTDYKNKK
ncbi:MAG: sigma-54-dependent Fis family transcriptional regulator [Gammaproteobacteria bacterium]|jgi:two-component system C4-dicarboxylate transport response regulator DctD|nr:sigma-54-dependent Fis family transcriptional regulator [Gammaproteobacteria bacterium]MBT3722465.1 sigma-54-dependent Fis family transcriptional regulator [Gammaproteobacteria bacterium]MBT4075343.1 sigma-54-dependent Fis family transcriptional regulator [Gammaproteobacteria bacterium]MBT4196955.1 sigma-54-dependent Fis family transcriptional regulator [Gammaproteobacteria bacterium]MBT4451811.1 sigma-54-dependent Fis family transcriptional regulator [Gammaproteobacteria bacterium]